MNDNEVFKKLRSRDIIEDETELLDFFDSLSEVKSDEILGKWKGGDLNTGHWGNEALSEMKWYGKWFKNKLEALPLVCFNDSGKLFSNHIMNGEASLWDIEFRGKVSATMVYDGVPIFDHFRKIDENTIFGIMNGKSVQGFPDIVENGKYYYFYLERVLGYPADFVENV